MTARGLSSTRGNRYGENARRKAMAAADTGPSLVLSTVFLRNTLGADSGTFVAPVTGWYDVLIWGQGNRGGTSAGTIASGGGAGGFSYRREFVQAAFGIAWTLNQTGANDTTVTLPSGAMRAGQGVNGTNGYTPGGAGGTASGGDVNRTGGAGGGWTNPDADANTNDGTRVAAQSATGGGVGADHMALATGFGGASPGPSDLGLTDLAALDGVAAFFANGQTVYGLDGVTPGGGAAGTVNSDPADIGGSGQILILAYEQL